MIEEISIPSLLAIAAMITAFGTAWLTVRKIARDAERSRKVQAASILQSAKEADLVLKEKLESKLHELEEKFHSLKEANEKDLAHHKETHSSDLKNLADKIEILRDELRAQSKNILELLTKMIGKQD